MENIKPKWIFRKGLERERCFSLSKKWGISPLLIALLHNRGIVEEDIEKFIHPSSQDLHDPFLMKDMDRAVERIIRGIHKKERILVYGDYDADGITATSLLLKFLRDLKISGYFYIPHRQSEGYGLNRGAIRKASKENINLIITCDCGISSMEEIEYAYTLGMEVIITDHHRTETPVSPKIPVLNPHQPDCNYPFKGLSGVGVAFKLCQALVQKMGIPRDCLNNYLDLVALGTIGDIVPLRGENRILVKLGLERLNSSSLSLGLRALIKLVGLEKKKLSERQVGYILAPRLNACGRLSLAKKGVDLILSTTHQQAFRLAKDLNRENTYRQRIERRMRREADQILSISKQDWVIVVAKKGWHPGVVGLVASYIREKYLRPSLVFSLDGKLARGSARSVPSFPIFKALEKCENLLQSFGGHKLAAGMTLPVKNIEPLKKRLNCLAHDMLSPEDFSPSYFIDAKVNLDKLNKEIVEELELLAPYGSENPLPLFLAERVHLSSLEKIRRGIKMRVASSRGEEEFEAIGFGLNKEKELTSQKGTINIIYTPRINQYRGEEKIQLEIKDWQGENYG